MFTLEAAEMQEKALAQAALDSPVRQVRSEMARRAKEWRDAVALLADVDEDDFEIDLAGAVAPGDRVLVLVRKTWDDQDQEAVGVLRVLNRDGQTSLHLAANSNGREVYVNFAGPASPVVVAR